MRGDERGGMGEGCRGLTDLGAGFHAEDVAAAGAGYVLDAGEDALRGVG